MGAADKGGRRWCYHLLPQQILQFGLRLRILGSHEMVYVLGLSCVRLEVDFSRIVSQEQVC